MTLAEYFAMNRPKAIWDIGDRVFGYWNKIPFIGTVGCDNMVSEIEGPKVSIFLDLPILHQGKVHSIIFVKQKQIKRLMSMDDKEPLKLPEAGSIPAKRTKQDGNNSRTARPRSKTV